MAGISAEQFLDTIRRALSTRGPQAELPDDLEVARVVGDNTDLVQSFADNVERALMHPYRVNDEQSCVQKVLEIVEQAGANKVIVPPEDFTGRDAIVQELQNRNITLCDPDDQEAAFDADAGITGVESAVVETASLYLGSGGSTRRLASLAPPHHIAIVNADQIVPDLLDWGRRSTENLPAAETLVSGPSKTADIELNLVLGVHGPREEHVVIVG
jgi:L-lactate dehydrogenase complex protein LldG